MNLCPICKDIKDKATLCKVSFTYKSIFNLSECHNCHLIYFNPTPSTKQFIDFYSTGSYEFDRWKQEVKAEDYIKKLNHKQETGKFLDIGCATGYMINKISLDSDWKVYGVELSKNPAHFARDILKLKNITHGDLFSASYDSDFFDYINIGDVLEHVKNPREFLEECRRILKPDGIINLQVPNGYSDSRGLIRYYKDFQQAGGHASGHVFFFQKETLYYLFNILGLDIISSKTTSIKNGLRNIGLLPKKSNWYEFYRPRDKEEEAVTSSIKLITNRKYPKFYYKYRYLKHQWFTLPGLHNCGLNFNILLTPSNKEK